MCAVFREALIIYRSTAREIDHVGGPSRDLQKLQSMVRMELREDEIEAGSELFGEAVRLLLSDEVQALVTAAAVGEWLWRIIKGLAAVGKRFAVCKPAVKCLVAARAKEEAGLNDELLEITKVWGPMVLSFREGTLLKGYEPVGSTGMSDAEAYMMAMAVPKEKRSVKMLWYIVSSDGRMLMSWTTQTSADGVPEFLRPDVTLKTGHFQDGTVFRQRDSCNSQDQNWRDSSEALQSNMGGEPENCRIGRRELGSGVVVAGGGWWSEISQQNRMVYLLGGDQKASVDRLQLVLENLRSTLMGETTRGYLPVAYELYALVDPLLFVPIRSLVTVAAIGNMVREVIRLFRARGEGFALAGPAVRCLVAARAREQLEAEGGLAHFLERAKAWGPIAVNSFGGGSFLEGCESVSNTKSKEAYMMAIAFPKEPRRVRTYWYIMSSAGEVLASWVTQTLAERVPKLLRPDVV